MQLLGPVIGGFLAAGKGWRWTLWLLVILGGAVEAATLIVMCEKSPYIVLERKAARLRISMRKAHLGSKLARTLTRQQVLAQALFVLPVFSSARLWYWLCRCTLL